MAPSASLICFTLLSVARSFGGEGVSCMKIEDSYVFYKRKVKITVSRRACKNEGEPEQCFPEVK